MIIVRLQGGLGNQLFQYAFAKNLAIKNKTELKIDISLLGENKNVKNAVIRHLDLDYFNLDYKIATPLEIRRFNGAINPSLIDRFIYKINTITKKYPLVLQKGNTYDEGLVNTIKNNACLVGRWQSESFFQDNKGKIKSIFSLNNFTPNDYSKALIKSKETNNLVGIQVRRGDYVTHPIYAKEIGALTLEYYLEAIKKIESLKSNVTLSFLIISDDINWCIENFPQDKRFTFVKQEKSKIGYFSDLWLLSKCAHNIISNSTFAWWGAWLGEKTDSIIISPKNWTRNISNSPEKIIPERWLKINNSFIKLK